jgi:coenzyme F420-dependent glucose-6-phosphate dehydrogenase
VTRYGYHASHEQHAPSALLEYVRHAEAAGFQAGMCSDHFHPWTEAQGQSGFAWSWLGAAMHATRLSFGTVNAPGLRYHPAIIAQAAATLAEMFPDRFWFAVATGEAVNEAITAEPWPTKAERTARLRECVDVIRALWRGETVSHYGRVRVQEAKLYTRPARPPLLVGAAITEETAEAVGAWADGLITVGAPRDQMRKMLDAFRRGGGEGKPVFVQHALSWAPTEEAALRLAHEQWTFSALGPQLLPNLRTPQQFEAAARYVRPEDLAQKLRISSDLGQHAAWLAEYAELGVDDVYAFNVNLEQRAYIDAFGAKVLPQLVR